MASAVTTRPNFTPISKIKPSNSPLSLLLFHSTTTRPRKSTSFTSIFCSATRRARPNYIPNQISDPNYVRIFDTTLREGEQSPGVTMTSKEKLDIARQLSKLGVDIIEAGFPAASNDNLEVVKMIAKEVGNRVEEESGYVPVICGLARCNKRDIDAAWEAVKGAKRPRIHTFIATSEIHLNYKLKKTREEVIEIARSMVRYARSLGCDDVQFSLEDAGRSNREFLYRILGEVIKAGASTVNIADTVGFTVPNEFGQLIADIKANTPGIENVIISTHCHNDLGLSTANTLEGAYAGARQVEVTINGIGERAGNASLEEVVMALKCRGEQVLGGLLTGINTEQIVISSTMVEECTGLHVQPHKAIVGVNAFAHESGIQQNIADDDPIALASDVVCEPQVVWKLGDVQVTCGTLHPLVATVKLIDVEGKEHIACANGTGPVDSAYKAIDLITKVRVTLLEHSMNAVTEGIDAIATTRVTIRRENHHTSTNASVQTSHHTFSGTGSGMDIVVSSVRAYLNALNKMLVSRTNSS